MKDNAHGSTLECERVIVQWSLEAGIFRRCTATSVIAHDPRHRHRRGAGVELALFLAEPTRSLRLCPATIGSWILAAGLRLSYAHLRTALPLRPLSSIYHPHSPTSPRPIRTLQSDGFSSSFVWCSVTGQMAIGLP